MLELEDIFGRDGPLQRALGDFRVRRQQLLMAKRVAAALDSRETLAVEAGTGTGKTFAYLVPALLSGRRVLISTGTRTLQDQLFSKDLPLVAAALGRPARVALLKGRSNYLCRYRLNGAGSVTEVEQLSLGVDTDSDVRGQSRSVDGSAGALLARIRNWARTTRSGDLSEVRGLSDSHPVWSQVTSSRENCLGRPCPEFAGCHLVAARREALEADIVVVNHHLLLADLALKEDGFGDILGAADAVILDEAHQIPDLATQFFGAHVGSRRIETLLKEVRSGMTSLDAAGDAGRRGAAASLQAAVQGVEEAVQGVSASLPQRPGRTSWTESDAAIGRCVGGLADALQELQSTLESFGEESTLTTLAERAGDLFASLERIAAIGDLEGARAAETLPRGFALSLMPFDISGRFQSLLEAHACAWIFTSATLSVGEDFSHFTGRLGLDDIETLKIDSPFDFERQSMLYLPPRMPEPASAGYLAAVIETAVGLIEAARGGAFVLFTSHRALSHGAALLREKWSDAMPFRLFVQGEAPRERLLQDFREDGNAVLLGTTSFWEGVDVKGQALRLVIIEKLPFASPDDPLVRARIDHLQATGGNAFRDYQLPEAALALKQGVGRLIRSEEDFGAVVICDPRMAGRGYGRVFVAALPVMPVTRDREQVLSFLARHAPRPAPGVESGPGRSHDGHTVVYEPTS